LSTCSTLLKAHQNAVKNNNAEKEVSKLADIVSYSTDAIISTDQHGMVVTWNTAAEKLLGYSKEEILGTSVTRLGPESLKKIHDQVIKQVQNGKHVQSYDTQQLKKGNTIIHVNMSIFPLIDEKGEVKGISSILRDISEQREAQKVKEEFTKNLEIMVSERTIDLEKVQKELKFSLIKEKKLGHLKSKFVATASHQFRTPLTVIKTNMGILEVQKKHMTDQFKPHLEKINKRIVGQIGRMTSLMDQVLVLGKINEDIIKPKLEPTDLVELCKSISKTYDKIQLDGREIKLAVNGLPETIMLDSKLMQEALSNLISNALKYSIDESSPQITINFNKNHIQISVKDEGVGIPEGDLAHIFEPFYRA
jgi:PAS domain S-box-containing protein